MYYRWMYTVHKKERLRKEALAEKDLDKGGVINTAFQKDEENGEVGEKRISNMLMNKPEGAVNVSNDGHLMVPKYDYSHRPSLGEINMAETIKCTSKI